MGEPGFWDNTETAQKLINETNSLKEKYQQFHQLSEEIDELTVMFELQQEEYDAEIQEELEERIHLLQERLTTYELSLLLNEPYDHNNALIELHPGAGGTESQDWGSMLLRMYTRWAESHGFQVETLDYQAGDEAGIKSVTLLIKGYNAYGYLKSEKGVHRLVRISPFDSAKRRHTSFCSVDVMPELDDTIEIAINPDDLKIDTYRASGAGGQHINKTDSAVRIVHTPTGITVNCQDGRNQLANKETALRIIKARVYNFYKEQKEKEAGEARKSKIGTGDRSEKIRTYNYPQNRVTDHRIGLTINQLDRIMEGKLDDIVNALIKNEEQEKLLNEQL